MTVSKNTGRPEIEESLKRNITINLKVNSFEKQIIDELLEQSDYYKNRNAMLRSIILEGNYTVRELKQDRIKLIELQELKRELHGIGKNFNQLVKHLNTKKLNYFTQDDKKKTAKSLLLLNTSLQKMHLFLNKLAEKK